MALGLAFLTCGVEMPPFAQVQRPQESPLLLSALEALACQQLPRSLKRALVVVFHFAPLTCNESCDNMTLAHEFSQSAGRLFHRNAQSKRCWTHACWQPSKETSYLVLQALKYVIMFKNAVASLGPKEERPQHKGSSAQEIATEQLLPEISGICGYRE